MKKWLSARRHDILDCTKATFCWLLANMREVLGFLSLLGIATGCWWILPALGLIVPSVVVFSCLAYAVIRDTEPPKKAS